MTAHKPGDPTTLNRLYGRSKGKALRAGQQALIDTLLPQVAVPAEGPVTSERLFGDDRPLHFEIGFGGGEHLAARADMLPDHGFVGCEPFINGVAQALVHISGDHGTHEPLANVRLHHGDALEVLSRVPDGTLSFLYLLHPDPWPKARHAKRRFVHPAMLPVVARVLKPGAQWRIASDDPTYQAWVAEVFAGSALFTLSQPAESRPAGWPPTRYEAKALREGRRPLYWVAVRSAGS